MILFEDYLKNKSKNKLESENSSILTFEEFLGSKLGGQNVKIEVEETKDLQTKSSSLIQSIEIEKDLNSNKYIDNVISKFKSKKIQTYPNLQNEEYLRSSYKEYQKLIKEDNEKRKRNLISYNNSSGSIKLKICISRIGQAIIGKCKIV